MLKDIKEKISEKKENFKTFSASRVSIVTSALGLQATRAMFQPYYNPKPKELIELEKWHKENPVLKDYVYKIPENYKKPSLYHPAYLGKKGQTEVDRDVSKDLNDKGKGYTYSAEDDKPKVPIYDLNKTHRSDFDIKSNIQDFIGNHDRLPVGNILFSQNDNSMEVLLFAKAGMRGEFARLNDQDEQNRVRKLRADARKKSRFKPADTDQPNKNVHGHPNWVWAHLLPVGYHGSEGDERLGVKWWGEDNSTYNGGNGFMSKFENRQQQRTEGFYWLTRIEKVDGESGNMFGGSVSGVRWIYEIYSQTGDLLESDAIEHSFTYKHESENRWDDRNSNNQWSWNFGIDYRDTTTVTEEEEEEIDENDIMADYVYSTERFQFESKEPDLVVSFGVNSDGNPIKVDLASSDACHLLYCGTTGSGKSVQVVSVISQLMQHNTPQQVQFVGIDPKMTEFGVYKDNPYWAVNPILDTTEASMLSRFALMVSETRSAMFVEIGVKNLDAYNNWVANNKEEAEKRQFGFLPHLFLMTDEFASLMTQNRQENEDTFNRIAAECRAQGVHAHLATQRPSVDVITGTLKNNFPAKCGLRMGSAVDSSTLMEVIDTDVNPHQLKGQGDNILVTASIRERSQGYYFSDKDVKHINQFSMVNYYGVVENTKIIDGQQVTVLEPDISKATQIKYKRDLVRAGLAEKEGNTYTLIKKVG